MAQSAAAYIRTIKAALTPDLLKPEFRFMADDQNPTAGHCYHAAEALWHLLGGKTAGWLPQVYREDDGVTHWWLRHADGTIADPTSEQYGTEDFLPYDRGLGKGCGFLTAKPSRRAQIIIDRAQAVMDRVQILDTAHDL